MVHIIYIQIVQSALVITKCKSSAHNLKLNVTVTVLTKEEYPKYYFFFSSRRRHTRYWRDWSSDVCSSDLRQLGLVSATALVVASMVGSGVFTTSGILLADLYSPSLVLAAWLAGGVIAVLGALCYGALARRYPESRSEERRVGQEWTTWLFA